MIHNNWVILENTLNKQGNILEFKIVSLEQLNEGYHMTILHPNGVEVQYLTA